MGQLNALGILHFQLCTLKNGLDGSVIEDSKSVVLTSHPFYNLQKTEY